MSEPTSRRRAPGSWWNPFRPYGPLQGWCPVFIGGLVMLVLILAGCGGGNATTGQTSPSTLVGQTTTAVQGDVRAGSDGATAGIRYPDIGFRSRRNLEDHFAKHGREFGDIDQATYLALAQQLRDRPLDAVTLEAGRRDGVVTRFDRTRGAFGAYNSDRTIRTYFRPDDGEAYFRRQATR